ncbi:RHS repeat-associated core domain-containing protein [Pseudomonas faucium]|uniref:RHS repeat-associated core domain-containing protein n=1 Tax=Pseudomonas faucium TaxID=2740518 RepID=UPI0015967C9C|nr:RHS repeat-associated core domain-containing protein [Pseudomonas faucium]
MAVTAQQYFYRGNKLATLRTGAAQHTIVSANNLNLGETTMATAQTRLLATDAQDSTVISELESQASIAYSPYGHDSCPPTSLVLSRFTGQSWLPSAIGYMLGNGHRLFNPGLMRFYSADGLSPFGQGGLNAYAYCANDPINRSDPSGKSFIKRITRQYSYAVLAPRLNNEAQSFSANEYKALGKSLEKRHQQNLRQVSSALDPHSAIGKRVIQNDRTHTKQSLQYLRLTQGSDGRYGFPDAREQHRDFLGKSDPAIANTPASPSARRRASVDSVNTYGPTVASAAESRQIEEGLDGLLARLLALRDS